MWNGVIKQVTNKVCNSDGIEMDSGILTQAPRLESIDFKSHNEQFTLVPF